MVTEIVGLVVDLHRDEDEEVGTIAVRVDIGRVRRLVKMNLSPEDYRNAGRAHDERRPVVAVGRLHYETGRMLWLTHVERFGFAEFLAT